MDVCYFLGTESGADDWELRYSLRSWAQFYRGVGNFHIVGHLPAWLRIGANVIHHPMPDPYRANKDANLIQKTIYVASRPEVSDPFILCSDDQFLLRHAVSAEFSPPAHNGEIASFKKVKGHGWWERLHRTGDMLRRRKMSAFHFDTHIPHVVTKEQAMTLLRWNYGEANGYCVFSLLFNGAGVIGAPIDRSPIRAGLYGKQDAAVVASKMAANLFLSIDGDSLKCRPTVEAIEARFPIQAPWEIYPPRSPIQDAPAGGPCLAAASAPAPAPYDYSKYLIR
jgi:hypothetical protein